MMQEGLILIIVTALISAAIGLWYSRRRKITVEGFITARSSLPLGISILNLVATGMGAWILFSPAETGVVAGVTALIGYSLGSSGALFAFIFVGSRLRKIMPNGHTLTEFILARFGNPMYLIILGVMFFYMALFLTAELTAIALASQMVFGIPLWITSLIVTIATVAYTAHGGFRATVFTDMLQGILILPLLASAFIGSHIFLGSASTIINSLPSSLLNLTSRAGIEYGITLILAIVGAELFNQANWQRVYAPKNVSIMRKAFFIAGLIIIPVILMAGTFGLFAVATGVAEVPSVALFTFLLEITPRWIITIVMVLAVILVMSTISALLNGMVSLFTVDLVRIRPNMTQRKLLSIGKVLTIIIALLAFLIAKQGYSVLYLFLIADLVCVAAAFPTVFGMFAKRYSGIAASTSAIVGIIAGSYFFPDSTFAGNFWHSAFFIYPQFSSVFPAWGNLLVSFAVALLVPVALSLLSMAFTKSFDFRKIGRKGVKLSAKD